MIANDFYDIAIIGAGASGTLTAIHLLRAAAVPVRIALIEPGPVALGVAYATPYGEHLLNVSAARMSAFEDDAGDFVEYLSDCGQGGDRSTIGDSYAQRRQYGAYLHDRLERARASRATLDLVAGCVVSCDDIDGHRVLTLDSGQVLQAVDVVLALGNVAKPLPIPHDPHWPAGRVLGAWDHAAIKAIDRDADVTVIGSGLSMVDVAMSLSDNGHRGALHVLSRNALMPLTHSSGHDSAAFAVEGLDALSLRERMRLLRDAAATVMRTGMPWQTLMNSLRPHVRRLWQTLSREDQRRFLRHVARYWDVHRHRIAPEVAAQLARLQASGQLRLMRGRLSSIQSRPDSLRVEVDARDGSRREWSSDVLVNAVGVELRATRMRSALLDDLLSKGVYRPGPHEIGIDTDDAGALRGADGRVHPHLWAIGSLRIGGLLESIAVPDLRQDAGMLASRLLAKRMP